MAAIEKAGTSVQRCEVAYAFTGVPWLAIPWHCPLGIFIQVSVQRISTSKRLTCCIGPFTEVSRRYGRIAKNGDFQFGVAGPFHCLQFGQRLDPASYFPICACDRAALPSRSTPIKHDIHVLFIAILFIVDIFERIWPEPGK